MHTAQRQQLSTPHPELSKIISETIISELTKNPLHTWKDATICLLFCLAFISHPLLGGPLVFAHQPQLKGAAQQALQGQ